MPRKATTTISDKKFPIDNNGMIDHYVADITSVCDSAKCYFETYPYKVQNLHWLIPNLKSLEFVENELLRIHNRYYYPFGVTMKGRDFNSSTSRFGFNSMEKIEETETMDFGARLLDGDLGVWLALDPLMAKYPSLSPYCFVGNIPIIAIDPDGRVIHLVGTESEDAFFTLLYGFEGVTKENVFAVFKFKPTGQNKLIGYGMTKDVFAKNYKKATGKSIRGKKLEQAYSIHRALASEETLEIAIFTPYQMSETNVPGSDGTKIVDDLPGFVDSKNLNKEYDKLRQSALKKDTPDKMEEVYTSIESKQSGDNWKLIPYQNEDENRSVLNNQSGHAGTIVIDGVKATDNNTQAKAIMDAIDSIPVKCTTCQ